MSVLKHFVSGWFIVLNGILREPLAHFFVIGIVLFGLDALRVTDADKARQIVVKSATYNEISQAFIEGRGRKPTQEELKPLVDTWVSNEILYREAKAMQLDQGDDMIRERVIQKVRAMIAGQIDVSSPTEDELRSFFDSHKGSYDQPALYTFLFAKLNGDKDTAEAQIAQWQSGEASDLRQLGIRAVRLDMRTADQITDLLGPAAAATVIGLEPGQWAAIKGPSAWGGVRLEAAFPPQEAFYETVADDVRKRWAEWAAQRQGAAKIADMRKAYDVVYAEAPASAFTVAASDQELKTAARPESR